LSPKDPAGSARPRDWTQGESDIGPTRPRSAAGRGIEFVLKRGATLRLGQGRT